MAALGDLLIRVGANIDSFEKKMGDVSKRLNAIDREAQKAFSGFDRMGDRLADVGGKLTLGITAPLAGLAAGAIAAFGTLDSLERGLNTVTGSAEKTAAQMVALREVAKLPGLGLQEAVQGSINLQTLGFSADKSKQILLQFGNAIASVGRGRDDLNEVIRQLGQLGARGQVTADNLKPIIERVPQVAKIIKDSFGPEALGNPAETFKKLGVSSEELIDKLILELGKLPRVTGGIKNDLENLKDTITISLGKIGASIAPFVSQAINTLVPAMEKVVEIFTGLPKPIQNAVIAFAAIAAAIGPILLVSGSMVSAIANIAAAVTAMGGILTSSLGVAALTALGTAAAAAATAFGAFKLGQWAYDNVPGLSLLGDAIGSLILKIPGVEKMVNTIGGVGSVVKPVKDLETQVRQTEKALRDQGIAVQQGSLTLTQYASKLADIKRGLGDYNVQVDTSAERAKAAAKAQAALKQELENQEKALSELKKGYELGVVSSAALEAQTEKVRQAYLRLHPEINLTKEISGELLLNSKDTADALQALGEAAFRAQFNFKTWAEVLGISNEELLTAGRIYPHLIDSIQREADSLGEVNPALAKNAANMKDLNEIIHRTANVELKDLNDSFKDLEKLDPFKRLGITSQAELKEMARRAEEAYNEIRSNAQSTALDIQRAWVKMIDAQIAAGVKLPDETRRQHEKVKAAVEETTGHVKRKWYEVSTQVSTIITDMGRQMSRSLIDVIKGTTSVGDAFKKMFESAGEALLRFVTEKLVGILFKELEHLASKILPGLLDKLGGLFGLGGGSGGGVLGTTVGAGSGPLSFPGGGGGSTPSGGGGGGLGAGSGGATAIGAMIGGPWGAAIGAMVDLGIQVFSLTQQARQEGTLNAIEQHTKVMSIAMLGISAPWEKVADGQDTLFKFTGQIRNVLEERLPWIAEFAHDSASALKDFIQPNVALMTESIRNIERQLTPVSGAQGAAVTGGANVTINVSGAGDPAAVAKAVMDLLKTQSPVFV